MLLIYSHNNRPASSTYYPIQISGVFEFAADYLSNVSSAPLKVSSKSSRRSVSSQTALPVASLLLCCQFEHQGPGDGRRGVTPHGAITAGAWRPYISFPIAFLLLLLLSSFSRPLTSTKLLENFVVACFEGPAHKLAFFSCFRFCGH